MRDIESRIERIEETLANIPARWGRTTQEPAGTTLRHTVSGANWAITAAHWELPEWLSWVTNGHAMTIPVAASSGLIYAQLTFTPPYNGYSGLQIAPGRIRLIADVTGCAPRVYSAVTWSNRTITNPLSPLLWLPVAKFTGTAAGLLTLDYTGACRYAAYPFAVWAGWLANAFEVRHGQSDAKILVVTQSRPHWEAIYSGGVTTITVDPGPDETSTGAITPAAAAGRTSWSSLYIDLATATITATASSFPNKYNMFVAAYTHDGYGNILDLALGGAPLGQWHT